MSGPIVDIALRWAADQIEDEMRHWPEGPSREAMAKVRQRILTPHQYIRHQLEQALKAGGAALLAEVDRLRAEADRAHDLAGQVMALREQLHRRRAVAAPTEGGTHDGR